MKGGLLFWFSKEYVVLCGKWIKHWLRKWKIQCMKLMMKLIHWIWQPIFEIGLRAGVTGQQRVLTPSRHLILPLQFSEVCVALHSILLLPFDYDYVLHIVIFAILYWYLVYIALKEEWAYWIVSRYYTPRNKVVGYAGTRLSVCL
jgi:hypothetical protein